MGMSIHAGWRRAALAAAILAMLGVLVAVDGPEQARAADARSAAMLTQEQVDKRYADMRAFIDDMLETGASEQQIETALAAKFNIHRLHDHGARVSTDVVTPMATSGSNVSLPAPWMLYDSQLRHYVAYASWSWLNCNSQPCWKADISTSSYTTPVGGPDGFAIMVSLPSTRRSSGLTVTNNCGTSTSFTNPSEISNYGVGYREQDYSSYSAFTLCSNSYYRYDWHRGSISYTFDFTVACGGKQIKIDSRMGHTWSGSVTDMTIGSSGISITFSSGAYKWTAYPQTPGYDYC